jgi:hypothetical protein
MADLVLKGMLNLKGTLTLEPPAGGKVMVGSVEALVEVTPSDQPQCSSAPPVILPPPPLSPLQPQPSVWIINSFNKQIKAKTKNIVALGMVMQGQPGGPVWPGMLMPSANLTVKANSVAINVVNDMASIFPSGGMATFDKSGQT